MGSWFNHLSLCLERAQLGELTTATLQSSVHSSSPFLLGRETSDSEENRLG